LFGLKICLSPVNTTHPLRIGAGATEGNPKFFFPGQIAEVSIWDKARTQAEIKADISKRLSGKEPNLMAYYPLNEIKVEGTTRKVLNLASSSHGTVFEANIVTDQTLSLAPFIQGEQFGKLAEVCIWRVALSDEEIAVNSKTLLSGNEPGLLAYYPLNEATGEIVRSQTGSGEGIVEGAIWWGCSAPIGNLGNLGSTVMQFDGVNDYVEVPYSASLNPTQFTVSCWVKAEEGQKTHGFPLVNRSQNSGLKGYFFSTTETTENRWLMGVGAGSGWNTLTGTKVMLNTWTHLTATHDGNALKFYINGTLAGTANVPYTVNSGSPLCFGSAGINSFFPGQIADVRIWNKARTQVEIHADMYKRLSGKEPNLVAYYPLNEIQLKDKGSTRKVKDLAGNNHGIVTKAITVDSNTLPIGGDALVSNEYSTVTLENTRKIAIMRRFLASPATNGVTLLPDKRVEALELKWIGNAQFAPTLLGYIEGPPPVPSENLTAEYDNTQVDDYNSATSVEITMSEDVAFNWNRSQDSGLGATIDTFIGAGGTMSFLTAPMGVGTSIDASTRVGFKGNFDFSYQFQNQSSITSSSSLSMTDKLEMHGNYEQKPKFPHLGTRFIPKNIGYALVVSALADVFITRLARSRKMVGYQVQPVDGIPPDINTITFLINPAYTMNGSLDGMTGSSATSDRFFKHVPEMRSQYGSLYPASYYRLQEAYDLKRQIEAEDKRRESYFSNFNVRLVDEAYLNRNIDSDAAPNTVGVQGEEGQPTTPKLDRIEASTKQQETATQKKQAEIQSQISSQEQRVHATDKFAGWQKRMEDIQIRAGKRNIVNTYVWDADGGLRTEAQSFANTVEHTIGGSYSMNAGLGVDASFTAFGVDVELTAQATVNLTQTMSKTEARSKGFQLNVDLSGVEFRGITDYNDNPIVPGEKVDRYRFMSFYLEGSTNNFQDFFNYVVDPEWLRSNDEEARALRQTQAGKPNKAWRVLHRVTYVERPALMGFGRDVRKLRAAAEISENQQLLDKIAKLEQDNRKLEAKIDKILDALKAQK
jgi:Concanavalin A-like lectin/glucanases superfamily